MDFGFIKLNLIIYIHNIFVKKILFYEEEIFTFITIFHFPRCFLFQDATFSKFNYF